MDNLRLLRLMRPSFSKVKFCGECINLDGKVNHGRFYFCRIDFPDMDYPKAVKETDVACKYFDNGEPDEQKREEEEKTRKKK